MAWLLRTISWHRRKIAALLTALGVFVLVSHLSGAAEATVDVVVTTTEVAAGQPLRAADLTLAPLPAAAIPAGASTGFDEVAGRSAAAALAPGTVLQPGLIVAGVAAPDGRSLVPITVHDAQMREILSPGMRIALVAAGPDVPAVVTDDAVVRTLPPVAESSFATTGQAALLLVEVPSQLAAEVSVLGQSGQLSVFLTG